jgi:hypothetical protein
MSAAVGVEAGRFPAKGTGRPGGTIKLTCDIDTYAY